MTNSVDQIGDYLNRNRPVFVDDRTSAQFNTHLVLVAATDKFMSGWGQASDGHSLCAWACRPEHADRVESWVRGRSEMERVSRVRRSWGPDANAAHVHVYVVEEGHPALA